jgi:cell division septation protein DedD
MPMRDAPDRGDPDRDILDIIPERYDSDPDSRQARRSAISKVVLSISLALLCVMALGVVARHILFGEAPRDRQISVPVIHADDKPIKAKPDERGGMEVPNQDKLIYERMGAKKDDQKIERLLPSPEQPSPPPAKTAAAASPAAVPSAAKPAPVPVSPPAASVPPTESKNGGWVVQLGAVRSEAEARAAWNHLKSLHKDELSGLDDDIVRVDLGAKGIYWRIRGGPLDEAQARLLCATLTKQDQGCLIARR